jgi:aspartyl-tRNA(Asn)/glutamyl-tRNA(Gln) amidotransferase subunit A
MKSEDLSFMTATELAPLIEAREVSPVELFASQLDRIEKLDPVLQSYIYVSAGEARASARAAETEIAAGNYRGPMHGITIGYKDIIDVRGIETTAASHLMAENVADEDATVVARFRGAGAVCTGKLNLIEFASGSMGVYGFARNPWNLAANPGTSSSGSGVALAAGLVTTALGTDTGGSVRNPAAFCNLAGLRPTWGRVSRAGCVPLGWSQDSIGPMARSVADVALMLGVMSGPDRRDPTAALEPVPDYTKDLGRGIKGLRIGVPSSFFFEDLDPEVASAMNAAIKLLGDLGAEMRPVDLPASEYASAASWTIAYSEAFVWHRDWFAARSRDYTPAFLHKITAAGLTTAEERIVSQQIRQVISREIIAALDEVDAIVTPTNRVLASANLRTLPQAGRTMRWSPEMSSLARPFNLAGTPAMSVPAGFAGDNTPIGMQLVAKPWAESVILRIGHAYERAAGWYRARPPAFPETIPPRFGADNGNVVIEDPEHPEITPDWVMQVAKLQGLTFVTEDDARKIAPMLAPVKEQLAAARKNLKLTLEPPTRPALGNLRDFGG